MYYYLGDRGKCKGDNPIYTLIISIQVISFFLIFKMVSGYSFSKSELVIYPISMLFFTFEFRKTFGVWGALFFLALFIAIGYFKEKGFQLISVFYALYALLMNSFLGYIVAAPLEYLFSLMSFIPIEVLYLLVAMMPSIINYLLIKTLEQVYPDYPLKSFREINDFSLVVLVIILFTVMGLLYRVLTIGNQTEIVSWQSNLLILILFLVVVFSLLLLNIHFQRQKRKEIQILKDEQLLQLQEYTKHVEALYEEIHHFKHDYINILTSLDDGIKNQDIKRVQEIYESVIKPTKQTFQTNHFMIARLSNILIPEIKSLISAKLLIARQNKIDIHVEVVEPIDKVNTDLLNLIRVLSNLLDNAIEATSEIKDSWIRIAMFKEEKTVTIIIENSILELIDIKKINEVGYSSKGTGRGIGLHTVQKILKNDTSLFLETSSDQQVFSQVLKIAGSDL